MLGRIANREDPDKTASESSHDLGLCCLSRLFWQPTSVRNIRTFVVFLYILYMNITKNP